MKKIAVVNSSHGNNVTPVYNLATEKIMAKFKQEGHEAVYMPGLTFMDGFDFDEAYFSAIFTWDIPDLIRDVQMLKFKSPRTKIEIGGPAATFLSEMIEKETGIKPFIGIDPRFESVKGDFKFTFTSRGCPRHCAFCIVSTLEPNHVEYEEFNIPVGENPFVCDNNIIATSLKHQEHVVSVLKNVKNLDLNSGFDCRIFCKDPEKYYDLYSKLQIEMWRFAYDVPEEKEPIRICAEFLHKKGVDYRHITAFCLIGGPGQKYEEDLAKLLYLQGLGTSPYPMRYRPLDVTRNKYTPPGYLPNQLELLFDYFGNPFIWRDFMRKHGDDPLLAWQSWHRQSNWLDPSKNEEPGRAAAHPAKPARAVRPGAEEAEEKKEMKLCDGLYPPFNRKVCEDCPMATELEVTERLTGKEAICPIVKQADKMEESNYSKRSLALGSWLKRKRR